MRWLGLYGGEADFVSDRDMNVALLMMNFALTGLAPYGVTGCASGAMPRFRAWG